MSNSKDIGIIDCGISNLGSIAQTVSNLGHNPIIVSDPELISSKSHLIFPGQGTFSEGMRRINSLGWDEVLRSEALDKGTPILGICLGMQLMGVDSTEDGITTGLNLIPSKVDKFSPAEIAERKVKVDEDLGKAEPALIAAQESVSGI